MIAWRNVTGNAVDVVLWQVHAPCSRRVFLGIGPIVKDAGLASLVLAGGAGALYLSQSAFWSVSCDVGGLSAGSVSGVMNMGCQLGGAVTASLTPWIAQHFGWTMPFVVAGGLCLLGAIAWLMVDPDQQLTAAPSHVV